MIDAYDAKRERPTQSGATVSDRISYVVTPDGKIGLSLMSTPTLSSMSAETLEFVRRWQREPEALTINLR